MLYCYWNRQPQTRLRANSADERKLPKCVDHYGSTFTVVGKEMNGIKSSYFFIFPSKTNWTPEETRTVYRIPNCLEFFLTLTESMTDITTQLVGFPRKICSSFIWFTFSTSNWIIPLCMYIIRTSLLHLRVDRVASAVVWARDSTQPPKVRDVPRIDVTDATTPEMPKYFPPITKNHAHYAAFF